MTMCEKCKKPLKAIGTARSNGKKTHGDWSKRTLHKSCWKEEQKYEELKHYINNYASGSFCSFVSK